MRNRPTPVAMSAITRAVLREELLTVNPEHADELLAMVIEGKRYPFDDRGRKIEAPGQRTKVRSRNSYIIEALHRTWFRLATQPPPGRTRTMTKHRIGQVFGYHHTAVMHGIKKVKASL